MSKAHPPELKKFMDKKLSLKLNGGRQINGILRGFDPFMNLTKNDDEYQYSNQIVICTDEMNKTGTYEECKGPKKGNQGELP